MIAVLFGGRTPLTKYSSIGSCPCLVPGCERKEFNGQCDKPKSGEIVNRASRNNIKISAHIYPVARYFDGSDDGVSLEIPCVGRSCGGV